MSDATYVFAGGGTGGHLYPGLAVAAALREDQPGAKIEFFTTDRPLDRQLLDPTGFTQTEQTVRPFTVHPLRLPGFLVHWRRSVQAARARFHDERPQVVLGLGGYAAGPPVVAARSLGIRTAILNPDAIPGVANRWLARHADMIVLQWDASRAYFPTERPCRTLGCPIRAAFAEADREAGYAAFGLDPNCRTLVVTGASQGARTVNRTLQRVWPQFHARHPDWQLLHLSGPLDEAETVAAYDEADTPARVVAFTHEMWLALAAADVVVSRAGASTLAELTALGRPSILFPYPYHRDNHQAANARVLVAAGAAILIDDTRDADRNSGPLLESLERLADASTRERMATAARKLGRPEAARRIANWLRG